MVTKLTTIVVFFKASDQQPQPLRNLEGLVVVQVARRHRFRLRSRRWQVRSPGMAPKICSEWLHIFVPKTCN